MVVSVRMASATISMPPAFEQALTLFQPGDLPTDAHIEDGYLDLLDGQDPTGSHIGQRAALSKLMPLLYGGLVHPLVMRMAAGLKAPGRHEERRIALEMLDLSSGDRVLDVGCGPGSTTRRFAEATGEGLVVGLDASPAMLAAAARRTKRPNVAYIRADGAVLPFKSESFDAVSCFGALHLFEQPMRALEEIARVLAPGGRVGLLATCEREKPAGAGEDAKRSSGMLMFPQDQIPSALRERGFLDVEQRVMRMVQLVSARKPA